MIQVADQLPRAAASQVFEALADTRIVVINGARQVGKSTLAATVARQSPGSAIRYLDNVATRSAAQNDPTSFVRHDGLLVIDEVQRVPDLWLALKEQVDRDPRPGRFILTGSARLLGLKSLPDQLPGRTETIELWPLSQGEIHGQQDSFIDQIFNSHLPGPQPDDSRLFKRDYLNRAARGGFPEAVKRSQPRRQQRFFASYLDDMIVRDIHQVADITHSQEIRQLLTLLAGQPGGLLNANRLASDLGLSAPTVRRFLAILETVYLIRLIPAFSPTASQRAVGTAKLTFVDTGIAAHLIGGVHHDAQIGGMIENFVLGELGRQLTWSQTDAQLFHYRDRDGYEVDAILENRSGQVIGIEVKASETARADDFRGLRILRDRLGNQFLGGFVLYAGEHTLSFGDRLSCAPISALWSDCADPVADGPAR
jgi:uncharacterized protein